MIAELNSMPAAQFIENISPICGSKTWQRALECKRPLRDLAHFQEAAAVAWAALDEKDQLEAFRAHPRIGVKISGTPNQHLSWSQNEQASVTSAPAAELSELQKLNDEYSAKFGFIFIICATGLTADKILRALKQRIGASAAEEMKQAALEQAKIIRLRIQKLCQNP